MTLLPVNHPQMMHLDSYPLNNSIRGLRAWADQHPHIVWTDKDVRAVWSRSLQRWVLIPAHWRKLKRNGMTHILDGGRRRRLTKRERRRPLEQWDLEDVLRLRGRHGLRHVTCRRMLLEHQRLRKRPCWEPKPHSPGCEVQQPWDDLWAYGERIGYTQQAVKTMPTAGWRERLQAAHAAGFETAVIGGGKLWDQPADMRVAHPDWVTRYWLRGWA